MRLFVTLFLSLWLAASPAMAEGMGMVRDAEIENMLHRWSAPMWRAAGLNPEAVTIVMIQNEDLNAFTAGGQVIFMTTGLILRADNAEEIVGVMAHETGHIVGGHVLLQKQQARNASYQSIIGMILGAGAGILTGSGAVGNAVTTFGQAGAMSNYLAHSRMEESAADQAGFSYLHNAGISTAGLATFLGKLQDQELLPPSQQQGYARTHPITRDRIDVLQSRAARDAKPGRVIDPAELARVQAKILAFVSPARAEQKFGKDDSAIGLMARAIVAYRRNKVTDALALTERWIKAEPKNPYAWELKGQLLKDGGQPGKAIAAYEQSLFLNPRNALVRIDAAHAIIEGRGDLDVAIAYLNTALRAEPRSTFAHRLLSIAYGQKGMEPEAQIHLAEMSLLEGGKEGRTRARELVAIAMPNLSPRSPLRRRASDLKLQLDSLPEED